MRKRIFWILGGLAALLLVAVLTGSLLLLSEPLPDARNWFRPGDSFYSQSEGFRQTISTIGTEQLYVRLELDPHAAGPPEHQHLGFDETFQVSEGVLSILVNGEKKQVRAGETITVPRGVAHRPFNETDSVVVVKGMGEGVGIPVQFAWHLSQLYPLMDTHGPMSGRVLQQVSVWGESFDSWPAGPPLPAQRMLRKVLAPFARLAGVRKTPFPKI
ncbi:MAG: cupin domain-containing protein [Bacteroidetes bacterium]|nr:MAG: cupin domain-containing protein [Bacteroidota bacterium]